MKSTTSASIKMTSKWQTNQGWIKVGLWGSRPPILLEKGVFHYLDLDLSRFIVFLFPVSFLHTIFVELT